MKKFITFLFLSVFTVPVYGATNCVLFDPDVTVSGREWVQDSGSYYFCGEHAGDDNGCPNHADVYANGSMGWGIYTCHTNGPDWAYNNPIHWIADCSGDPATEAYYHYIFCNGNDYVYFADYTSDMSYSLMNMCKISQTDVASYMTNCESSGGSKLYCETNCLCDEGQGKKNKTGYECECIDSDAHLDEVNGTKYCVKGNFYPCETDADCLGGRTPVKPSHSTAWRCVNQKYEVKVCAATACEDGWHVKTGYGFCEKDEPVKPKPEPEEQDDENDDDPENDNPNNDVTEPPAQDPALQPQPQKQVCPDPEHMDTDCNCTVPGTTKRGNKCVCTDSNRKIRDGQCEYTAAYINKITADITETYNNLTALVSGFGVSKWRDAEGNFNTARLASDGIAGIVLGTVGGVVTAHLVKKAQIKQGFEDLQCQIGGQSVAGYGDTFTVGR